MGHRIPPEKGEDPPATTTGPRHVLVRVSPTETRCKFYVHVSPRIKQSEAVRISAHISFKFRDGDVKGKLADTHVQDPGPSHVVL